MIFLLARRLMRDFDTVVGVNLINMFDGRHDLSMSRSITTELVGKEPAGVAPLAFDQAAEEAYGRLFIASPLDQDINGIAILIDGPPEILLFPLNRDDHFIEVPGIA